MDHKFFTVPVLVIASFFAGKLSVGRLDPPLNTSVSAQPSDISSSVSATPSNQLASDARGATDSRFVPSAIKRRSSTGMEFTEVSATDKAALFERASEACFAAAGPLIEFELEKKQTVAESDDRSRSVTKIPKPPPEIREAMIAAALKVYQDFGEFSPQAIGKITKTIEKDLLLTDADLYVLAQPRAGSTRLYLTAYFSDDELKFELGTNDSGVPTLRMSGATPSSTTSLHSGRPLFKKRLSHLFR